MSTNLTREYIDLIHQASGEWTNWDPPQPVQLGDFGTLEETGQFIVDGNIYSDDFRKYLKGIKSFDLNAYPTQFTEFDQNYITFSSGVKKGELDVGKFAKLPGISSASFKGTWTFEDGKRGALLILLSSYTVSTPEVVFSEILDVERLAGKHLVTTARVCPAYLKFLSDKSGQTVSVAFFHTALGMGAVNTEGVPGWWTDSESMLLSQDTHPHGKSVFTPLFSLKQSKRPRKQEGSGPKSTGEYERQDVPPVWKPLEEDGKKLRSSTTPSWNHSAWNPRPSNPNIRKFIDLVRKVSGKWTNWDPPIPVTVGDYGTLDENGEFHAEGNIYSDEFQEYLENHQLNFVTRDHPPRFAEPDQDYIVASSGVTRGQLNADFQGNAAIASARIKGTWKFRDGKRGALIILVTPRTSFVPNWIMTKIFNVELLKNKYLVASALVCPAYLMYVSNKSGESFSVAFCPRTNGDLVNGKFGDEWWTENESALLRRASHSNGEYRFTPLFSLKQPLKRTWLNWRGDEEQPTGEEYPWGDVYPDWKPLDEDGEEIDD